MPNDPGFLITFPCSYRRFESLVYCPILMISGKLLHDFLVLFKNDEVSDKIKEPAFFAHSPDEHFNFSKTWTGFFTIYCLPLHEPLLFRCYCSRSRLYSVAYH